MLLSQNAQSDEKVILSRCTTYNYGNYDDYERNNEKHHDDCYIKQK